MRRVKYPFYVQTLGMLFAYLMVLAGSIAIGFNLQFGFGWDALLRGPLGDRVDLIVDRTITRLGATNQQSWSDVLMEVGSEYGTSLRLFDPSGFQLAGNANEVPQALRRGMLHSFPLPKAMLRARRELKQINGINGFREIGPPMLPPPHSIRFRKQVQTIDGVLWIGVPLMVHGTAVPLPRPAVLLIAVANVFQSRLLFDFGFLTVVIAGVVAFSLVFWWPFAYIVTRRLSALTEATGRIAEGDFSTKTEANDLDEIGVLARSINTMAHRLNQFVEAHKRLLADISHELVTPLARLDMAVELLPSSHGDDQTALIDDAKDEIRSMHHLIDELLAFTKLGIQGRTPDVEKLDLRGLIDEAITAVKPAQTLLVDIPDGLAVIGDAIMLTRAFSNVLRNSARYAGDAGSIRVAAVHADSKVSIEIYDDGPGVPESALPHLGEPFFRPEFARSRDGGGVGLGLAIVKGCVECCGGSVVFSNATTGGFRVSIRLPAVE